MHEANVNISFLFDFPHHEIWVRGVVNGVQGGAPTPPTIVSRSNTSLLAHNHEPTTPSPQHPCALDASAHARTCSPCPPGRPIPLLPAMPTAPPPSAPLPSPFCPPCPRAAPHPGHGMESLEAATESITVPPPRGTSAIQPTWRCVCQAQHHIHTARATGFSEPSAVLPRIATFNSQARVWATEVLEWVPGPRGTGIQKCRRRARN